VNVLVTGALGTIGRQTVIALAARGHRVRALDLGTLRNRVRARAFSRSVECLWGDLRRPPVARAAVAGMNAVVHLAAVLPPRAYDVPELVHSVNVGGTSAVLEAARACNRPIALAYASSCAVYGITQHRSPPVRETDPVAATDEYTRSKLDAEALVRQTPLPWVVLRLAHVPILGLRVPHRIMFDIPLDNRIELLHASDAALALACAVESQTCRNRVLLVGGGATCQVLYRNYLERALAAMGLPLPPPSLFGTQYHYSDWLDAGASQALWQYQRHAFEDIMSAIERRARRLAPLVRAVQPAAASALASLSPYRRRVTPATAEG
jgi:UDP-glucose 4-epimerase